jgi:gamma-glutamyltranspeptidase/glutathione hydrolase
VIQSKGGCMTLDDLKNHTSTIIEPITYSYGGENGVTMHECPPNGQGITALIALGVLEALEEEGVVDMNKYEHNSVEWLHTLMFDIFLH